jgi:hypothetical protein
VAVHQRCYDVDTVPETDWLCWPCREHEEAQRAAGVPQAQIRPPHGLPLDRAKLGGGAREARCALCPIRGGAFRRTVDGAQWVHQACAAFTQETYLTAGTGPNVVAGLGNIPARRWEALCDICGLPEGAAVNCRHPGTCAFSFHVLCARNCGLYLPVRLDVGGRPLHRIYCAIHSRTQRARDAQAAAARVHDVQRAAAAATDRASRADVAAAGAAVLGELEAQRAALGAIRLSLEHARTLLDQCRRREKLKRAAAALLPALHAERLAHPAQALDFVERLRAAAAAGMPPGELLRALGETAAAAVAGAAVAAAAALPAPGPPPPQAAQQQQQQAAASSPPARTPAPPPAADEPMPDAPAEAAPAAPGSAEGEPPEVGRARRAAARAAAMGTAVAAPPPPTTGKRKRAAGAPGADAEPPAAQVQPQPRAQAQPQAAPSEVAEAAASEGGESGKRARSAGGGGARARGPPAPAAAADSLPPIEKEAHLSSAQAAELNRKLPPGIKYIPKDQLPPPAPAPAAAAAAPAAAPAPAGTGTAAATPAATPAASNVDSKKGRTTRSGAGAAAQGGATAGGATAGAGGGNPAASGSTASRPRGGGGGAAASRPPRTDGRTPRTRNKAAP